MNVHSIPCTICLRIGNLKNTHVSDHRSIPRQPWCSHTSELWCPNMHSDELVQLCATYIFCWNFDLEEAGFEARATGWKLSGLPFELLYHMSYPTFSFFLFLFSFFLSISLSFFFLPFYCCGSFFFFFSFFLYFSTYISLSRFCTKRLKTI